MLQKNFFEDFSQTFIFISFINCEVNLFVLKKNSLKIFFKLESMNFCYWSTTLTKNVKLFFEHLLNNIVGGACLQKRSEKQCKETTLQVDCRLNQIGID